MWPYNDAESDWLEVGAKKSIKDYLSTRVFDGVRILSKEHADRLRKHLKKKN